MFDCNKNCYHFMFNYFDLLDNNLKINCMKSYNDKKLNHIN